CAPHRASHSFPTRRSSDLVRKESDRASALQGCGQRPLVPGARARHAARQNLAAIADEPAQARNLLVVDIRDLLHAEAADLAVLRSEEHTSELQSRFDLVCR